MLVAVLSLLACSGAIEGTWMFSRPVAPAPLCADSFNHNLVGAYAPAAEDPAEDTAWTSTDTGAESEEVFFGRITSTDAGALLVVGTEALPGVKNDNGGWTFEWVGSEEDREDASHATGYVWQHTTSNTRTLRVAGDVSGDGFGGTWDVEESTLDGYTESDAWSADVEAYVGATGNLPSGSRLLRLDASTGAEVPATNERDTLDCNGTNCTLSIRSDCAVRTTFTAVRTDLEPSDSRWVQDAGQTAGP